MYPTGEDPRGNLIQVEPVCLADCPAGRPRPELEFPTKSGCQRQQFIKRGIQTKTNAFVFSLLMTLSSKTLVLWAHPRTSERQNKNHCVLDQWVRDGEGHGTTKRSRRRRRPGEVNVYGFSRGSRCGSFHQAFRCRCGSVIAPCGQ